MKKITKPISKDPPPAPTPKSQPVTKARTEEQRADDEYFVSGTRYPGQ